MTELRRLQIIFTRLLPRLIDHGFVIGLLLIGREWWRTDQQAAWNAEHGIGIKLSLHRDGLAVDLVIIHPDGSPATDSAEYLALGVFWESLSGADAEGAWQCCWGGRFKKPDGGHFSLSYQGRR